jgi:hypothetical protein
MDAGRAGIIAINPDPSGFTSRQSYSGEQADSTMQHMTALASLKTGFSARRKACADNSLNRFIA